MENQFSQMPVLPDTPENRAWVDECIRVLGQEIDLRVAQRQVYYQMRAGWQHLPEDPTVTTTSRRSGTAITEDIDLTDLDIDFTGTETVVQRLVLIAGAAPDRYLNVTQVARCIQRSGVTDIKLHSIRVAVHRALEGNPNLFELVRPATYRYVGGAPGAGVDGDPVEDGSGPEV